MVIVWVLVSDLKIIIVDELIGVLDVENIEDVLKILDEIVVEGCLVIVVIYF